MKEEASSNSSLQSSLSIFDLDHTLISVNGSYEFCRYLFRHGELSCKNLFFLFYYNMRHTAFPMPIDVLYRKVFFRLCMGRNLEKMRHLAGNFVSEISVSQFHSALVERLNQAKKEGQKVLILSSSPEFLVEAFADRFGVKCFAGTSLEVDEKGDFCQLGNIMEGTEKAKFFEHFSKVNSIPLSQTVFYSDSSLDLPAMERAGQAVVVNPGAFLKKQCKKNGYEIIST